MRILVVAYEFPPSLSPGALRWHYLVRELAQQNHQLCVLTPKLAGYSQYDQNLSANIYTERVFAGPLFGLIAWCARKQKKETSNKQTDKPGTLNWKGRIIRKLQDAIGHFIYPDARAEWMSWARPRLMRVLREFNPDIVISTHEPSFTLLLGFEAAFMGIPFVADLGDPIAAPYIAKKWQEKAFNLEKEVCKIAHMIVVTTHQAAADLIQRQKVDPGKVRVVTQGFDDRKTYNKSNDQFRGVLELFYSGRFYPFRRPDELIKAVAQLDGIRLSIATPNFPSECYQIASHSSGKIRILGQMIHEDVLKSQYQADVLVNFGNDGLFTQVPGKIYEYFGTGKPVLHVTGTGCIDPSALLIKEIGAGWTCQNNCVDLTNLLSKIAKDFHRGTLASFTYGERVARYGWSELGARYSDHLEALLRGSVNADF